MVLSFLILSNNTLFSEKGKHLIVIVGTDSLLKEVYPPKYQDAFFQKDRLIFHTQKTNGQSFVCFLPYSLNYVKIRPTLTHRF